MPASKSTSSLAAALIAAATATVGAQTPSISWFTIDGGGGASSSSGFTLAATAGQPDAGAMSAGAFVLVGGFWSGAGPLPCYANCDGSAGAPVLNVNDFICFQSRFAASDPYADCDHTGSLNVNDFVCFQAAFAAGCP